MGVRGKKREKTKLKIFMDFKTKCEKEIPAVFPQREVYSPNIYFSKRGFDLMDKTDTK